jgi:hypothetical protein
MYSAAETSEKVRGAVPRPRKGLFSGREDKWKWEETEVFDRCRVWQLTAHDTNRYATVSTLARVVLRRIYPVVRPPSARAVRDNLMPSLCIRS